MNEDIIKGRAAAGLGELEGAAGEAFDNRDLRRDGASRARAGRSQAALGSAEDRLSEVADHVGAQVSRLQGQAKAAADRASQAVRSVSDTVDPFVRERPYAALGIAAAVGLLAGLLIAAPRAKVVYVRPPAP